MLILLELIGAVWIVVPVTELAELHPFEALPIATFVLLDPSCAIADAAFVDPSVDRLFPVATLFVTVPEKAIAPPEPLTFCAPLIVFEATRLFAAAPFRYTP